MRLFLLMSFLMSFFMSFAQKTDTLEYPEVGKPMPDFVLRNIAYYSKKEALLKDFRGKWLMLDFWNRWCSACIESFPRTNELQKKFNGKVQVMLVGIQDPNNEIQSIYTKFRERESLSMPCAFDSMIAQRFDIFTAPHIILIDDKGIVRSIATSLKEKDLLDYLDGKNPEVPQSYRRMHDDRVKDDGRMAYDPLKPFLIGGNGADDKDFLYGSILSRWSSKKHVKYEIGKILPDMADSGRFQVTGITLEALYDYAFWGENTIYDWSQYDTIHYGKCYPYPILAITDSSLFTFSYKESRNIFSYSLNMSQFTTIGSMMLAMQNDLKNYFGYQAFIENRKCPYWRLVANKDARVKLKTKGGEPFFRGFPRAGFIAKNKPYSEISGWIVDEVRGYCEDETGISGNVDLTLDCIPSNFEDLKKALRQNGLDLVRGEKEMKVLVIHDKNFDKGETSENKMAKLQRGVNSVAH